MLGKLVLVFFTCFALVLGQNGGFLQGLLNARRNGGGRGGFLGGLGGLGGNNNNGGDAGNNQDDNNNQDGGDNGGDAGNNQDDGQQNVQRVTNLLNTVSQGLEMGTNLAQQFQGQEGAAETAVGLGAASNVVGAVAGNLAALQGARGNPRGLIGAGLNMASDITQGLDSVGIGNGVLGIVSPGLRGFGGILGGGQAVAEDDFYDEAEFADQFAAMSDYEIEENFEQFAAMLDYEDEENFEQFAAMSDYEDEENFEQFDFASADSATTLPAGQSASNAIPGWAIGLLVIGGLVLVALIVVQVQIILVLRRRLPSERNY